MTYQSMSDHIYAPYAPWYENPTPEQQIARENFERMCMERARQSVALHFKIDPARINGFGVDPLPGEDADATRAQRYAIYQTWINLTNCNLNHFQERGFTGLQAWQIVDPER